ncbi:hypothetical protein [Olleya aquimaris]|uniref:Uncharacterized protein n=1 Tax=Olleya aquimaris TaxID=639310 RepID=A0A327RJ63_9FLAO|nr:hypothetical protein [Olleya aquimaris]RAJ17020.1 hypothetical protein LY08_00798 [Olleya aquimaris]
MSKSWTLTIAIVMFLIFTYVYWKLTKGYVQKVMGKKMWSHWGNQTFYWTNVLLVSGFLTVLVIYLLRSSKIVAI